MAKKVLTVDDSVSIRQMVSFTLGRAGYEVVEAIDGRDGLGKAMLRPFDLVITDQNMPNMDGLTLVKMLRGLPEYKKTPLLVLTTESGPEMKTRGREAGATGWLVKPFDPARLLEVVGKVLN